MATNPPPDIAGLTYLSKLGAGGYADVYLYEQAMPARKVAVKVMRTGLSGVDIARFVAEANAMAQLEHPHIVPVYTTGRTDDGRPYLVMMYYPNESLAERARRERFSVADVLRIGIQICAAVETAHRAGLLHRDIKPANILTSQYGTPGLTDFGIAAQMSEEDVDDTGVSVPWSPVETLYATSPGTVRSDVYSLSATLWHLLVGRSPFEEPSGDNSTYALMRRIRDVPAPSTGRSDVPMSLDRLLRTGLAKQANVRPASALQLARSLQAIEQELRLTRTEIPLAEGRAPLPLPDSGTTRLGRPVPPPATDSTRLRAPQVAAQPVPASGKGPGAASVKTSVALPPIGGALPARVAVPLPAAGIPAGTPHVTPEQGRNKHRRDEQVRKPDADEPATVLRGAVAQAQGHSDTAYRRPDSHDVSAIAAPAHGPAKRWGLIAVGVIVLVSLVVVLVAFLMPDRGAAPAPTTSPTADRPTLGRAPAPGEPVVTAERDGDQVTFSWTYENPLDTDTFLVAVAGEAARPVPEARIVVESGAEVCAGVKVMRADGSNLAKEYSKEVCG